ncbi:hypothetical protein AURDEDRAFT_126921 [Auricularia subglabra TFB-10046 SS5]|nr:hypothetical protein AURDEDRAFT_126921 [Auricularia subglabra TFB-10046 SS5]
MSFRMTSPYQNFISTPMAPNNPAHPTPGTVIWTTAGNGRIYVGVVLGHEMKMVQDGRRGVQYPTRYAKIEYADESFERVDLLHLLSVGRAGICPNPNTPLSATSPPP